MLTEGIGHLRSMIWSSPWVTAPRLRSRRTRLLRPEGVGPCWFPSRGPHLAREWGREIWALECFYGLVDMGYGKECPRSREANTSLLRNMMFQYSGGSITFWRPKINGFISSVVERPTGYHPSPGPIFGGTKRQHFAIRTAVNGPLSPQTNPQEVHNCGASELLLTRPGRAFSCWDRGVWHVFGDTVFVWLWPVTDFTCVVWRNTAQSGRGLSKLYEVLFFL